MSAGGSEVKLGTALWCVCLFLRHEISAVEDGSRKTRQLLGNKIRQHGDGIIVFQLLSQNTCLVAKHICLKKTTCSTCSFYVGSFSVSVERSVPKLQNVWDVVGTCCYSRLPLYFSTRFLQTCANNSSQDSKRGITLLSGFLPQEPWGWRYGGVKPCGDAVF